MASGSNGNSNTKGQGRLPFKSTKSASRRKKLKIRKRGNIKSNKKSHNNAPF